MDYEEAPRADLPEALQPFTSPAQLGLAGNRVVSFKDRGQAFTYIFRRIQACDWQQFFAGIVVESERLGKQRVDRIDHRNASLALLDASLSSVEGYKTRGQGSLCDWPNWKDRLPYGHRIQAATLLQEVRVSEATREFILDPDTDEVSLTAAWGSAAPGSMIRFDGLLHRFRPPSAEDQRRFNRASSEARVVGGGRSGRTIYPGKQQLLAALYDQLVIGVEGYAVEGEPLSTNVEMIRREMDALHKVAAVQELFVTPDVDEE